MQVNEYGKKKSVVDELNFGRKTARRVFWEAFEFTVFGPQQVKVTNASYGYLKDDHSYVVRVAERDGRPVPERCGCPADEYSEEYDCKHKVALAAKGGSVVLDTAMAYEQDEKATSIEKTDRIKADGDILVENEDCTCSSLGDLPCWSCYQAQV